MNSLRPFIMTLIAAAVAIFGGAISLLGTVTSPLAVAVIALILLATIGLIFISYNELDVLENADKEEELERQQERDKVQLEILGQLKNLRDFGIRTRSESRDPFEQREKYQREQRLLKALEQIAENINTVNLPNVQRLETSENQQTEENMDDIPSEADSAESQA
jgi:hypothetical protein